MGPDARPLALVTGASRRQGIAAAIAQSLARDGWDVATTFWRAYDERVHGSDPADIGRLREQIEACGAKTVAVEADLSLVESAGYVFDAVERALGSVTALVLCHCEGVDSDLLNTTVESFDRHFAVNAVVVASSRSPATTSSATFPTARVRAR
jgi:3-oxoacyl-[acyl-carrier protein] reductase